MYAPGKSATHRACEGRPQIRRPKSIDTNSASSAEWLTHPCRLEYAAMGNEVRGAAQREVYSR
eukprot:8556403-Lingulodinium_polyedra.AAC.1